MNPSQRRSHGRTSLCAQKISAAVVIACMAGTSFISNVASATTPSRNSHLARITALTLVGHGWGAGSGMGQWGAFGYAVRYHFGYERILGHYYGGTSSGSLSATPAGLNPTVTVVINENTNLVTNFGYDPIVTAATTLAVTSQGGVPTVPTTSTTTTSTTSTTTSTSTTSPISPTTTKVVTPTSFVVPASTAIDLHLEPNGTWNAYEGPSCGSVSTASTPVATGLVNPIIASPVSATAPLGSLEVLCRHDGVDESLRGGIEAYDRQGYERTLNVVPLESYLRGVVPSEVSASWGTVGTTTTASGGEPWGYQALLAQAVASRSYAMGYASSGGWNGYANICDTTSCQVYSGANYESPMSDLAVAQTAGEIRVLATNPSVAVQTTFSASTGGYSAPSTFPATRDRGDACIDPTVPAECNPSHTWQVTLTGAELRRHFGSIGALISMHVVTRNHLGALGGRALTVLLHGKKGRLVISGDAFAAALGLQSNWFAIAGLRRSGQPVVSAIPA